MGIVEQPLLWSSFLGFLLFMLGLDLFVFQRKAHVLGVREALAFTLLWVSLALVFCGGVYRFMGSRAALEFLSAYLIEFALSVDNLFVFLTLFTFFGVPHAYRHRALFWGIFGAIVMRITFILVGIHLVSRFDWLLYVFGVLLIYTGIRLVFQKMSRWTSKRTPSFGRSRGFPYHQRVRLGPFLFEGWSEVDGYAAFCSPCDDRNDGYYVRAGLDPGGFRSNARPFHCLQFERVRHPGPSGDVFCAGWVDGAAQVPELRPCADSRVHRGQDDCRPFLRDPHPMDAWSYRGDLGGHDDRVCLVPPQAA